MGRGPGAHPLYLQVRLAKGPYTVSDNRIRRRADRQDTPIRAEGNTQMPGLFSTLGSYGRRIIQAVRETGRSIRQAIGLAPKQARDLEPSAVARDFTQVARLEEQESLVATLPKNDVIPDYLHTYVDIPFKRQYAYTVVASGRALAGRVGPGGKKIGGQFIRDEWNLTFNRRMTPNEIEAIALRRFGAGGKYPLLSVNRLSVTAAMTSD